MPVVVNPSSSAINNHQNANVLKSQEHGLSILLTGLRHIHNISNYAHLTSKEADPESVVKHQLLLLEEP